MNEQAGIMANLKLFPSGSVVLAGAAGIPLAGWLSLYIDWTDVAQWLRVLVVFYGNWMMDP